MGVVRAMKMVGKFESEEIEEFVKSAMEGIEKGLGKKYFIKDYIEFELAVVNVKHGEGGIKLFVVDASGNVSKENVSKIKFKIENKRQKVLRELKEI